MKKESSRTEALSFFGGVHHVKAQRKMLIYQRFGAFEIEKKHEKNPLTLNEATLGMEGKFVKQVKRRG